MFTYHYYHLHHNHHDAMMREQWKNHKLYGKKKETLVTMCKDLKIESSGKKPEIVERLALAQKDDAPCPPKLYDSKKLPKSTNEIGQLSLCYLQSILKYHGFAAYRRISQGTDTGPTPHQWHLHCLLIILGRMHQPKPNIRQRQMY